MALTLVGAKQHCFGLCLLKNSLNPVLKHTPRREREEADVSVDLHQDPRRPKRDGVQLVTIYMTLCLPRRNEQ